MSHPRNAVLWTNETITFDRPRFKSAYLRTIQAVKKKNYNEVNYPPQPQALPSPPTSHPSTTQTVNTYLPLPRKKAYKICHNLLAQPSTPILERAGAHFILSGSSAQQPSPTSFPHDTKITHAQRAVMLYTHLRSLYQGTRHMEAIMQGFVEDAEAVLDVILDNTDNGDDGDGLGHHGDGVSVYDDGSGGQGGVSVHGEMRKVTRADLDWYFWADLEDIRDVLREYALAAFESGGGGGGPAGKRRRLCRM